MCAETSTELKEMKCHYNIFLVLTSLCCALHPVQGYINLSDTECGIKNARQSRIVGGSVAQENELPWTASLWRQGAHQCGATIISNSWLVTAGHCVCSSVTAEVFLPQQLKVVVGHHNLSQAITKEYVSRIVTHPDYLCDHPKNDIALLQTVRPLKWSNYLAPTCLPQPTAEDYSGSIAVVAGWGWLHEDRGTGKRPNILHKVEVSVIDNDQCTSWYNSQGTKIKMAPTQMCAGFEEGGRDSCWADSGGPLTLLESGRSVLAGVVSTGHGCARPRLPGIYTRLSKYVDWIQRVIDEQSNSKSGLHWYPH